ncbi:PAS domain S-box protein [Methanoculleus taiwanensis]|uniref:PAS domain S-box protein n=1 Tax=Methanoculleus taiwanensis TaxID=1550565 RepID=UPI0013E89E16|nr:PAS domain S-box protein [Methanoculleus taiwanensis]
MQQEEHDTQTRILRALRFRPKGMTITDVAKQIGATRSSASKHLEILQIAGRVDVRSIGNAKLYSLAQRVPMSAFLCFTRNLILILDASHRIVQVNDQCLRLLQRSKDDLVGLTLEEAALPIVSKPEAIAVVEGLEREQVVTDLGYRSGGKDLFFQMQAIPTTFDDGEKGATLVLEDITERKQYVRNMEFLAMTAMELVDMPAEADIYQYIGKRIIELAPEACVYVLSYDEINQQFSLRATEGESFHDGLIRILRRDPIGLIMPFTEVLSHPQGGNPISLLHSGTHEIVFYPDPGPEGLSFYDLCFRQIPEEICEEIRQTWNLGKVYVTFLVWGEQLFGDVGIFMAPHEKLENQQAIESFLRQTSIAIARRQTEERLRRSERRFRDVIDSSPIAAAIIESDGRYSFINRQFADLFGYTLADIPTGREWFRKAFPDETSRREAIAAWKSDREQAGKGTPRPRTFRVRCKGGEEKAVLFRPVELCDGTEHITYEDVTEERRAYRVLVGEIAELRRR